MIKISKDITNISVYSCQPKTREELRDIIEDRIFKEGPECDLNDIDVSKITDMSWMFYSTDFNGDISKWNVSNVKDMSNMFRGLRFNKDISKWDVSNVEDMRWMFKYSKFNKNISNWKINKDCQTLNVFINCPIKEEFKPKSLRKI